MEETTLRGRVAIAFLNRNSKDGTVTSALKEIELDPKVKYQAYDVWKHETVKQPEGKLTAEMKPHECQVFVLSPVE